MPPSLREQPFQIYYSKQDNSLGNFYIPALSVSVRYDRSAGYFSSSSLAVASAGVARLIQNGGRMRLLVGAELLKDDVEAIRKGSSLYEKLSDRMLERLFEPQDFQLKQRLEVLAWMVSEGTLEIKVVLPTDKDGIPIPAHQTQDYYHSKSGIFTDANGDQVAFSGSINESVAGWKKNFENFSVYFSWNETAPYLAQVALNFERLWNDQEQDWIAVDVPTAVKERLIKYRPVRAPLRDPLEKQERLTDTKEKEKEYITGSTQAERILFQFVRDAPFLPNAFELGTATSAVIPWPHQSRVADAVLKRFPERALLSDEVGLGKTIEAGMVLRQLLISGRIKRCLILTPKSVLKQWQEELYEKFALDIPRYDSGRYLDVDDQQLAIEAQNPWDSCSVMLASSQLAKRSDRRQQILEAHGWDLLLVDEAHHARRKDFKERIYRPNQLLSLLSEMIVQKKIGSLILMTATPMQIHPLEVWDLLSLLGSMGRWGADEDYFLEFFNQVRKPFNEIDWEFVFDLVQDYFECGGQIDAHFRDQVQPEIGPVQWSMLEDLPRRTGERKKIIKRMDKRTYPSIVEFVRLHTPLDYYIFRSTRELLREYERMGIMKAKIPSRKPNLVRVSMRPEEQALYERIDEYITHFYHKYENERRGLGFVMTVYRRRLTSSFFAVRCSLERRLAFLQGQLELSDIYTDDDTEQDELDTDVLEVISPVDREYFQAEVDYLQDFIGKLRLLSVADSKLEELKNEINRVFRERSTLLVFTQYTDTMDYLRSQLVEVYGSQVACYSGRGGEVWNGIAWVVTTKESVKNKFLEGNIRILLCTESASEGLNLQTCGVLINYDMPWNPMRVEQRIGRIDRIGQEFDEVWISNYFYIDTIEDRIYQRLSDRINWFETVVGELQPILAEVEVVTRRLAMLPAEERQLQFEEEIAQLRSRLQRQDIESLNLDDYIKAELYTPGPVSPLNMNQLEELLSQSQATSHLFQQHLEIPEAYSLNWSDKSIPVTFSPGCYDAHPDSVQFLTYGNPLLHQLLDSIPGVEDGEHVGLLRCQYAGDFEMRAWYTSNDDQSTLHPIKTLLELRDYLEVQTETPHQNNEQMIQQVESLFESEVEKETVRMKKILEHRLIAQFMTQKAKGQSLLLRCAYVKSTLGQNPDLFDSQVYTTEFGEHAIRGLQRHGYPWGALLSLAYGPGLEPDPEDTFFQKIRNDSRESLLGRYAQMTGEARRTVQRLSHAKKALKDREEFVKRDIDITIF